MSTSQVSPEIDVVETFDGVRYVLHASGNETPGLAIFLSIVVRVPLVAAALAGWLIWRSFGLVPGWLIAVAGMFVAQMVFVLRLPWNLFRQRLWQTLIAAFGQHEIELRGNRLLLGSRVGMFRSGNRRAVADIRRIVVYVYESTVTSPIGDATVTAGDVPQPAERAVLAIETEEARPWLLTDGFSRGVTLGLADDLHHRLAAVSARASQSLPEPVVEETQESTLYPPLGPDFYLRRKPLWLAAHICGSIGLAALTAIAMKTGAWQQAAMKGATTLGWLMELLILGTTLSLRGSALKGTAE